MSSGPTVGRPGSFKWSGVEVANSANVVTVGCVGGTLTAAAGTGVISYTGGGSAAAGTVCTISVDVTSAVAGVHVNTSGDLTSSLGNSGNAIATLVVTQVMRPVDIAVLGACGLSALLLLLASASLWVFRRPSVHVGRRSVITRSTPSDAPPALRAGSPAGSGDVFPDESRAAEIHLAKPWGIGRRETGVAEDTHLRPCSPRVRRSLLKTHRRAMETETFRFLDVRHDGGSRLPRHTHDQPMLVVMAQGGYTHMNGLASVECRENDIVFVPPGEPHCERIGARPARAHLILPRPDALSGIGFELPRRLHRFSAQEAGLAGRFLGREIRNGRPNLVLEALAFELMATVSSLAARSPSRPPVWLEAARRTIERRCAESLDLTEIAEHIGISRSQLSRGFRRWYGCSVWEYLCGTRLERAAELLRRSRRPLADIALECGFYDQSHFGKSFRRRFGTSPASFRRRDFVPMRRSS